MEQCKSPIAIHPFFSNIEDNDFITMCHKRDDLKFREVDIKAGYWVNFTDEFGDVWHRVVKTYIPEDFYGSIYCHDRIDEGDIEKSKVKSYYFYKIRKISETLPDNARILYDEDGKRYP